jgi:hypothetical protein
MRQAWDDAGRGMEGAGTQMGLQRTGVGRGSGCGSYFCELGEHGPCRRIPRCQLVDVSVRVLIAPFAHMYDMLLLMPHGG